MEDGKLAVPRWLSVTLICDDPVIATLCRQDDWWPELFDAVFALATDYPHQYNFIDVDDDLKISIGRKMFTAVAILCYGVEVDKFFRSRKDPLDVEDREERRALINAALLAKKFIKIPRRARYPQFVPEGRVAPLTVMWTDL
jgi:hypothetical protein